MILQTLTQAGAQDLPVAVVGEFIVTGEGYQHPKPNAQGEAYLGGSINPNLQPEGQTAAIRTAGSHSPAVKGDCAETTTSATSLRQHLELKCHLLHGTESNLNSASLPTSTWHQNAIRGNAVLGKTSPRRWPEQRGEKGAVSLLDLRPLRLPVDHQHVTPQT